MLPRGSLSRFLFNEGPENEEDVNNEEDVCEEEDIDSDDIDESEEEEEDTMPPKKSSNAAKPSSKKNAAAATTTTTNDCMASAPFSPFVLISYKMVRYSLSNGDSFAEVLLSGSGFSDVDDFEFDLVQDGGALSFTHAIPPTFFDKAPPDHSSLTEAERKSLRNDSRTVQYANLARKIHSDLKYDINAKGPFFCQPQVIVLERKCERIVDNTGFVVPTRKTVSFNGKQHHQFMTTYWCKLKEVAGDTQQRSRGNRLVIAGDHSFDDDDDDDDNGGSSSPSEEDSVQPPAPRKGGGGGGGGKRGGGGGGAGTKKKSKSKSHALAKLEPNIKSEMKGAKCAKREPGASCGISDPIEIFSQSSADDY